MVVLNYYRIVACRCTRGSKEFLRIVDAEIGQRDFMLDIKFKDLQFEA